MFVDSAMGREGSSEGGEGMEMTLGGEGVMVYDVRVEVYSAHAGKWDGFTFL